MSALHIVDADGHIREDVSEIQGYLDPPFPAESFSCRCGRVTADSEVADSDFPHTVTFERFVREVRGFIERKDLPPDLSRRTLWDNPKRL